MGSGSGSLELPNLTLPGMMEVTRFVYRKKAALKAPNAALKAGGMMEQVAEGDQVSLSLSNCN